MKRIMRKNQVVVTTLAILVAVAGYLSYTDKLTDKSNQVSDSTYEEVYKSDDLLSSTDDIDSLDVDLNELVALENNEEELPDDTGSIGETILTSGVTTDSFILEAKMNREQIRSKNKEELQNMLDNTELLEEQQNEIINEIVKLTSASEIESATETLLSAKGFENSIVSITDDCVDVLIIRESISDTEKAQIEDIVKRKTNIGIENIVITLKSID